MGYIIKNMKPLCLLYEKIEVCIIIYWQLFNKCIAMTSTI